MPEDLSTILTNLSRQRVLHAEHLSTYLNDHLTGSAAALELLEYLSSTYPDTEISKLASDMQQDVGSDRKQLESLMAHLHITQSNTRKASAWLVEKLVQAKLYVDDSSAGPLRLLEVIEAISLGIEGKKTLLVGLAAIATEIPELARLDYDRLIHRAQDQRNRLEPHRQKAARDAFAPTPP